MKVIIIKGLVVFDLDSTLIDAEIVDELGEICGRKGEIEDITRKAMEGELNYEESLRQRVKHLEGIRRKDVKETADKVPLMDGAKKTIQELQEMGYKTAIITGSFKTAAQHIGNKLGIDIVVANELVYEDGCATGQVEGPVTKSNSKGKVLKKLLSELKITNSSSIVVGDGANDLSMFKVAGYSIAFNSSPILTKKADVALNEKDLRNVLLKIRDNVC
ncbi:phosphoserine phosphatase SerB [Methanonatronarchaeum sp. AMET-Sl]|uniref:phosphoserine phosphatase SerB n=1 Tax=Methanonatronarchaeum sp. AMET-Sl TaxID=3037654 RepID=UPI00244DFCB6|nr:phosphoserine phosphatase SerB [Methanonatronarchaeum sp. AMET-Sl]WGI17240.1 phosphoserine phosphatase SerB [Methanonatronarchaeum sp. AMET-Sl]